MSDSNSDNEYDFSYLFKYLTSLELGIERIKEFGRLKEDWDDEGSLPSDPECVKIACNILPYLYNNEFLEPPYTEHGSASESLAPYTASETQHRGSGAPYTSISPFGDICFTYENDTGIILFVVISPKSMYINYGKSSYDFGKTDEQIFYDNFIIEKNILRSDLEKHLADIIITSCRRRLEESSNKL